MARLRLEHGTILPLEPKSAVIEDGTVVIDGANIAFVGPASQAPVDPDDEVIDCRGCAVMPGLVNAHTHVSMTLLRGYADDMALQPWLEKKIWPAEMKLRPEDVYWGAMLGIAEMIRGGVTTFSDMYHYFSAVADAVIESGIRGAVSGVLLGILPTAEDDLRRAIEFTCEMKRKAHPRLIPMLAPHAIYTCPDPLLVKTAEAAANLGVRLHIHLSETEKEVADCIAEHGETPVAHLESLGFLEVPSEVVHCVHLSDADITLLAKRQAGVVLCPTSNLKLASGFARTSNLMSAGACLGFGTDGAASNNNLDMFQEMKLGALLEKARTGNPEVVHAADALAMATRGAAATLGLAGQVGTLTPGLRADVIVVDLQSPHLQPHHSVLSHLVYSARAADVRDVIIEGEVVMRDRELFHLDEVEIIAKANECARRLVG
jgi:5-methylthioadenosine/S-adenosylhomocysteine deaminase